MVYEKPSLWSYRRINGTELRTLRMSLIQLLLLLSAISKLALDRSTDVSRAQRL